MTSGELITPTDARWGAVLRQIRHDVYHTQAYVQADGVRLDALPTAFVVAEEDRLFFLPLLLRSLRHLPAPIHDGGGALVDAVSPYGYPGILLSAAAAEAPGFVDDCVDELTETMATRHLASVFVRLHPILNSGLGGVLVRHGVVANGLTVSVDVRQSVEGLWRLLSHGHARAIARARGHGYSVEIGRLDESFDDFIAIYDETLDRLRAPASYHYGREHLRRLAQLPEAHLAVATLQGEVAGAYLFFEHQGIVEVHLGGTRKAFLTPSPSHLIVHAICLWARARGAEIVHLGGGVGGSSTDGLFTFKARFSPARHPFDTLRLVADRGRYDALVGRRGPVVSSDDCVASARNFFPEYRVAAR